MTHQRQSEGGTRLADHDRQIIISEVHESVLRSVERSLGRRQVSQRPLLVSLVVLVLLVAGLGVWSRAQLEHAQERLEHAQERLEHAQERLEHAQQQLEYAQQQRARQIEQLERQLEQVPQKAQERSQPAKDKTPPAARSNPGASGSPER